jgi:hypothetical protein
MWEEAVARSFIMKHLCRTKVEMVVFKVEMATTKEAREAKKLAK